jgi:hypothetical protein
MWGKMASCCRLVIGLCEVFISFHGPKAHADSQDWLPHKGPKRRISRTLLVNVRRYMSSCARLDKLKHVRPQRRRQECRRCRHECPRHVRSNGSLDKLKHPHKDERIQKSDFRLARAIANLIDVDTQLVHHGEQSIRLRSARRAHAMQIALQLSACVAGKE